MEVSKSLTIGSLNCRGLEDNLKRRDSFDWLKKKRFDICLLQETHSVLITNKQWETEWGYKAIFSNYNSRSRGVAILINNTINHDINGKLIDDNGRYIILDITVQNKKMTLVTIYGPNNDDPTFFEELEEKIINFDNSTVIIGGDWNVVQNFGKDTLNCVKLNNPGANEKVLETKETLNLVDIWRDRNPGERKYTWRGRNSKMSRLDYFLVSEDIAEITCNTSIKPGYRTDHSLISIEISLINQQKGRGTWKFNNSLLQDRDYVNIVKQSISETVEQYSQQINHQDINPYEIEFSIDDQLFFEMIKLNIRAKTIPYAAKKKRERIQREINCEKELEILHAQIMANPNEDNQLRYEAKQLELKEIREPNIRALIIRAKSK